MAFLTESFKALIKEGQFTKEMLGSGATQIRNANYARKGIYFQAFTSLSTGLERIGKLCLLLDHYVDHSGRFPEANYMKRIVGHNIATIYEKSALIIAKRSISMRFLKTLDDPIHQAILSVLSKFAMGDRYSNIDLLVRGRVQNDPVDAWFKQVDQPLFEGRITQKKKDSIKNNSEVIAMILNQYSSVLYVSETGDEITGVEAASDMTGRFKAVAPYRQLCVLQIIRYWVELLSSLQDLAMGRGSQDIPYFAEIFAAFYNDDSVFKKRKTWDKL